MNGSQKDVTSAYSNKTRWAKLINKPEDYPELSDGEEKSPTERPISSVLDEISSMLGTVIKTLEKKTNQS